jgi:hypothetical protein
LLNIGPLPIRERNRSFSDQRFQPNKSDTKLIILDEIIQRIEIGPIYLVRKIFNQPRAEALKETSSFIESRHLTIFPSCVPVPHEEWLQQHPITPASPSRCGVLGSRLRGDDSGEREQ